MAHSSSVPGESLVIAITIFRLRELTEPLGWRLSNFNNSRRTRVTLMPPHILLLNYAPFPWYLSTYQDAQNCQLFKFYIQFPSDRNLITARLGQVVTSTRGGKVSLNFL